MDVTVGTGDTVDVFARLMDGNTYDNYGSERAPVSFPVTEELRAMLVASGANTINVLMNQLAGERGKRGTLYRTLDDGSVHWCYARLIGISARRAITHRTHLPLTIEFARETKWYGVSYSISGALDTSPTTVNLPNYGTAPVTNCIITLNPGSGSALTGITISASTISSFTYTGTVAQNTDLDIDCGAYTVENNSSDDYANFSLDSTHTIADWLRIQPDGTDVRIDFTGGGDATSSATFNYYESWE